MRKVKITLITVSFFICTLTACTSKKTQNTASTIDHNKMSFAAIADEQTSEIERNAKSFFEVYTHRNDLDQFMTFYAPDAQLQDLVYGEVVSGHAAIRGFYQWDVGNVELIGTDSLQVKEQVIQGNTVVTRGVFLPFKYHGQTMGPWRFIIWQEYNSQGKIIKQYDWINYTPKETFIGGENLNELPTTKVY
ncbi:MAG: hypothetical protein Alis3KO_17820 [Aliiglaciecola sp.]